MQSSYLYGLAFAVLLTHTWAAQAQVSEPKDVTQETLARPEELARLQTPGHVFFQEDFESLKSLEKWYNRIGEDRGATQLVLDPAIAHSGRGVLQVRTVDRDGRSSAAGVTYWFHPGYDTVYFRRYIKFVDDYDQGNLNHVGGSLYAVAGNDKWAEMGTAGIRPDGNDRLRAGFAAWRA